jgi:uncharacterized protein YecT (DUF1311 family)
MADFTDLQKAQPAWLAFRDSDCTAIANIVARGGTAGPMLQHSCLLRHTVIRAIELEQLAKP